MTATAEALMRRVERALRPVRWLAAGAVLATVIGAGLTAGLLNVQHQQCQAGNSYRASDAANWDDVLAIVFGGNADPRAVKARQQIGAAVHRRDAPRACPWLPRLLP